MRIRRCTVAVGMIAAFAVARIDRIAWSQTSVESYQRQLELARRQTQSEVQEKVPASRRAYADYGAYASLIYLSLDDPSNDNRGLWEYDLVGFGRVNLDDVQEFYVRGRAQYFDFNPGDGFNDEEPDHMSGTLEEAYYRLDLSRLGKARHDSKSRECGAVVTAGRQFAQWATGLVLNQYVDGATGTFSEGDVQLDVLAGVTVPNTVDFDSSRPDFDSATHRGFFGVMPSIEVGSHRPYAYVLVQRDYNHDGATQIGNVTTTYSYNSFYLGIGSRGAFGDHVVYDSEMIWEGGSTLSNNRFDPASLQPLPQTKDDIQAFAAQLSGDYLFNDPRRSRVGAGMIVASGDRNRQSSSDTIGGNRSGTLDRAFNGLGLLDTGLVFAPEVSNLVMLRARASTYLSAEGVLGRAEAGVQGFIYWKYFNAGGIDEPSSDGSYLGVEPEIFLNWQILEDVTIQLRYGVFFPGGALPTEDVRQGVYGAITYAF